MQAQWKAMNTDTWTMSWWRVCGNFLGGSVAFNFSEFSPVARRLCQRCATAHLSPIRCHITPSCPARRSHHPSFHTRHMVDPIRRHFTYHDCPDVTWSSQSYRFLNRKTIFSKQNKQDHFPSSSPLIYRQITSLQTEPTKH